MKDMSKGAKTVLAAATALVAIAAVLLWSTYRTAEEPEPSEAQAGVAGAKSGQRTQRSAKRMASQPERGAADESGSEDVGVDDADRVEPGEQSEADLFDAVVDSWMEPSEKGVTMDDVDAFAAAFRAVPEEQRDDCIRRALNLIPDDNALLLAGVLMDKSQDKAIVETVFNDVLNRAEEVKMPMLRQIFKDRSHPCWADTAWIFDATGETSAQ